MRSGWQGGWWQAGTEDEANDIKAMMDVDIAALVAFLPVFRAPLVQVFYTLGGVSVYPCLYPLLVVFQEVYHNTYFPII